MPAFALGDTLTTTYGYDYRERPTSIQTGSTQNLAYTYDDASNVSTMTDNYMGWTMAYTYDNLNRLTNMTVNNYPAASSAYNAIGNMTSKSEVALGLTLTYPASGPGSVRPHAVTSTSGSLSLTLGYDANGNLATQGSSTYTFDAENRLKTRSVTGGTASYVYDASGTNVKRVKADGSWTVYIGGVFEKNFANSGAVTGYTKYYGALGRTIAMRTVVGSAVGAGTVSYLLSDHLGSASMATNATAPIVVLSNADYYPYGDVISGGVTQTDRQFTGQRVESGDSALGLYNYKARFYSTILGRFASPDPLARDGLNRYSYVNNRPLIAVDPSGLDAV